MQRFSAMSQWVRSYGKLAAFPMGESRQRLSCPPEQNPHDLARSTSGNDSWKPEGLFF